MKNTTHNDHYVKEMRKGLLAWYDFARGSRVLYVGEESDPTAELLVSRSGSVIGEDGTQSGGGLKVTIAAYAQSMTEEFLTANENTFDYLICIETLELSERPVDVLKGFKKLLKPDGILLLGMNNRFAARFFCGDRDKYTGRNFDGIENYYRAYMKKEDTFNGRMYDHAELVRMLSDAGFADQRFYSVMAGLQNPSHLFAYGYTPKEDLSNRFFPAYDTPETVFLDEEVLYRSLIDNGMFHQMAGAYLIEACVDADNLSDALQITCSAERERENAMATVLRERRDVLKKNLYPEGRKRLLQMTEYAQDLRAHGLKVIDMELTDEGLVMPLIDAPTGQLALKDLLLTDQDAFLKAMDHFRDLVMASSDVLGEVMPGGLGATLRYGYLDLVPLNSFYMDGTFVFFDQEFREEKVPANVILMRLIQTFFFGNGALTRYITPDELYERYGLTEYREDWQRMEWRFIAKLRNEEALYEYHKQVRKDANTVNTNRQSMNYPAGEYERLFVDIFRNADTRKLILFGSGRFAQIFCELYAPDYPVYAVVDNQEKRWGEKLGDVEIQSPELLSRLSTAEFKVIICIKNYLSVMRQLKDMGVNEFSIFDPARDYPRRRHPLTEKGAEVLGLQVDEKLNGSGTEADPTAESAETAGVSAAGSRKRFHIGYVSGVFDLYHVGHQNLFRRAKEQCDYLIVGVVSDKGVIKYKGVAPFVPFEERIELVRGCRYVDEAVEIPVDRNGPKDALSMYHFDVMFQGSDHMNDPYWLEAQEYLREHGSDIVFFPYTLSTNSTNLKALIEKKLM